MRVAGVPTGKLGNGYSSLDEPTRAKNDQALAVITDLPETGDYDSVIFSSNETQTDIGTGIFDVDVRAYIFSHLIAT